LPMPEPARPGAHEHLQSPLLPLSAELGGDLPRGVGTAVIGGGLAGCALAYYLAKSGAEVALLERGELNREASGTNSGSFHFQVAIHQLSGAGIEADRARLVEEVRLQVAAAAVWSDLERELGADLGVHITGGLMVAETAEELDLLMAKNQVERQAGLETHVLIGAELQDFAPYLAEDLKGATYCPLEGYANPLLAAPAFAARAAEAGAALRTHARVSGVEPLDGPGAAKFLVRTTRGDLRAGRVVNAAGAWAGELAALNGIALALKAQGLHVNVTEPREQVLTALVQHIGRRLTLKQAANGTFIIGGGWPARPEPAPARYSVRWRSAAGNGWAALRVLPLLADVRVMHMWAAVWASSLDFAPLVGEVQALPGYYVCVAPTGFTLGPLLAQRLAEAMLKGARLPEAYAPGRAPTLTGLGR
jgi:glycine/D-amino acid oxidase-like deaminating enzyme